MQLRRTVGEHGLSNSFEYAKLLNDLNFYSHKKIVYKREIDDLVINSDMDKLADLDAKFKESLTSINKNLANFNETSRKIRKMKIHQKLLLENVEDCLKIITN